jgi:pSer/pThr/pTyr-binding forkhead associated (FHA) protein
VEMILEVVHPGGARTWHRLGGLPLSVGRGLTNDLILEDPYVDPQHARISVDEAGSPLIEDLGSVNGLVANDSRHRGRLSVQPGAEVRVGRTTLRFHDPAEPVAPALADEVATRVSTPGPLPAVEAERLLSKRGRAMARIAHWANTNAGRLVIAGAAMSAVAIYAWMGSSERSSRSDAFEAGLAFAISVAMWAGIWAVASRMSVQRFNFLGHVAVASLVAVGALGWSILAEWLTFFFPDASLADVLSGAIGLFLLAALVAGHLALASAMSRTRQWRTGFIVSGTVLVIAGIATLAEDDAFTDVPTFSGVVKPVAESWVPTETVSEFGDVMLNLKEQVDEMAKQ